MGRRRRGAAENVDWENHEDGPSQTGCKAVDICRVQSNLMCMHYRRMGVTNGLSLCYR